METIVKSLMERAGRESVLPLCFLLVGLWTALEGLGVTRAGFHLIGYQQFWANIAAKDEPAERDFRGALTNIEAAAAIRPNHPGYPDDRAVVLLEHALRGTTPLADTDDLAEGIVDLERALTMAPARAGTWTRLALARFLTDGNTENFHEALRMSYLLGLYEPPLLRSRLQLSLYAWEDLPGDLRRSAEDQITQLWRSREGQDTIAEIFLTSNHQERYVLMRSVPQDERTLRYFFAQIRRHKKELEASGIDIVPPKLDNAPVELPFDAEDGEPATSEPEEAPLPAEEKVSAVSGPDLPIGGALETVLEGEPEPDKAAGILPRAKPAAPQPASAEPSIASEREEIDGSESRPSAVLPPPDTANR